MKILVTGDRNWTDVSKILDTFMTIGFESPTDGHEAAFNTDITVIEGGASGADTIAKEVAEGLGWKVIHLPADWEKYGKAAGPIRNQQMLEMDPDLVIAFHSDLDNSKGTKDMVNRARKSGKEVLHIV